MMSGASECGGSEQALSPEWMPASSMCSMMPATNTRLAIGDHVDVDLDRVLQVAIDQDRPELGELRRRRHELAELGGVVHDPHGPAAEHVGGADHQRKADRARARRSASSRSWQMSFSGWRRPSRRSSSWKRCAVLGQIDRIGRGAEDRHAGIGERLGELERGLAAELDDHPAQLAAARLDAHDLEHVLGGQRLEIQPVGGVVVGRDGLGVAVDHDRLDARLGEPEHGVHAAVVELDPLADPVRSAAQDDHLAPLARRRLAFRAACRRQAPVS